jgi:putative methyltransferase
MMMKSVYFNEYNVRMGGFSYLPLVSGLLRSYAETYPLLKEHYRFMPFIYAMERPAAIFRQYTEPPAIACFSSVMWNEQLNYHIARHVKEQWPECLVVFGGPNVPMPPQHSIDEWMRRYRFVDVAVRGEGEEAFADILTRYLSDGYEGLIGIPGVAVRDISNSEVTHFNGAERPFKREMDEYPSPYLEGLYDNLIAEAQVKGHQFQAIIETNRGCPFPCTFCYWGRGGLSRRFRYLGMDRVQAEIDWMGRNQVKYVFNADSNFGMHPRDQEIAEFIVATKGKYGCPEKFRTCFGKNTDEKIFKIGALFHANQLEKGITLSRQSNDEQTLKNIRRSNIKMSTYVNLQKRFNALDIPVYGDLILGLPGETKESWRRGVDELLEAGTRNQLFMYLCQVYPNTEMGEDDYRRRFGIRTKVIKLAEIHGEERPPDFVQEYEEVVIQTDSMSFEDWKDSLRFSYTLMLFHSLKMAYFVMIFLLDRYGARMSEFIQFVADRRFRPGVDMLENELDFYDSLIRRMVEEGEHRGTILREYGDLYWDVEEASFLRLTRDIDRFYVQLTRVVIDFLASKNIASEADRDLLDQVMRYQRLRMPHQNAIDASTLEVAFDWNLPEYFEKRFTPHVVDLQSVPTWMKITPRDWQGDLPRFARDSILWGRKSGTMLVPHIYGAIQQEAAPAAI